MERPCKNTFIFMSDENTTPEQAVNLTEETVETPEVKEPTVAEVLQPEVKEEKHESVPLNKYLDLKSDYKELKADLEKLQKQASETQMTKAEVADDLEALAKEHNIDPAFLNKLAGAIKSRAEKDIDAKLRPFTEKEKKERIDSAFDKTYTAVIADMPEYEAVVNPEVIKQLSLQPTNKDKTFRQIIEETYGNAIQGKRTIETTNAHPKTSGALDYNKAKSDTAYFKEVMADPKLKAEYNSRMLQDVI